MGKILIVDDTEDIRFTLSRIAGKEGHIVFSAAAGREAVDLLKENLLDLVFLDIGLPDVLGLDLIPEIRAISPGTDIVMITGRNDAATAVAALKAGARDYLVKPFEIIEFRNVLTLIMENRLAVKRSILDAGQETGLIGESPEMIGLKKKIRTVGGVKSAVLITGETGTGKELVARAIHDAGKGKGVFVKVDCGTLSAGVIESELFGYEKGAFTDAKADKRGLVEIADGGTLFLDEIGNLPLDLQPKLLRVIEESVFRRVGGLKDIRVDLRVIAATNLGLEDEVRKGRFREDLFYRLKVIALALPALRDRGKDILLLARHFLSRLGRELKKPLKGFDAQAEEALLSYQWPGNIRELRNTIERAVIFSEGERLIAADLELPARAASGGPAGLLPLAQMERRHILKVLDAAGGNKTEAARILGISRSTLREKLRTG